MRPLFHGPNNHTWGLQRVWGGPNQDYVVDASRNSHIFGLPGLKP